MSFSEVAMVLSIRSLSRLPDISTLKLLLQSLAMLDAILSPNWEYRYYSFDARWDDEQMLASMRNGEGDDYFCLFDPHGAIVKGFYHESPLASYRSALPDIESSIADGMPASFTEFLTEPAFKPEELTFCIWRTTHDTAWQCYEMSHLDQGNSDGSRELLSLWDGKPESYHRWASIYYQQMVGLSAVAHIYQHRTLTTGIVAQLNPNILLQDLADDMAEIGYRTLLGN